MRVTLAPAPHIASLMAGYGQSPLSLAKMSALCRRLCLSAALFAPWEPLTIKAAGHWNQCRFPGIVMAGDGEPAL
jgi:hypothetical protein